MERAYKLGITLKDAVWTVTLSLLNGRRKNLNCSRQRKEAMSAWAFVEWKNRVLKLGFASMN